MKIAFEGLTYDDVLLVPARSAVMPRSVSLQSRLTRNIRLNVPVLSAAMDTVTESDLAIAIAREGGAGVLHKNMTAEQQAARTRLRELIGKGPKTEPVIAVLKQALTPEQLAHVEQQIEANGARDAARGTPRDRARGADRQGTRAGTRPGERQLRAPRMDGLELPAPGLPGPGD